MLLGIIADDFTGATDIASFFVENGLSTIQLNGVPNQKLSFNVDVVVISLKSRSIPKHEAIKESLSALQWLEKSGCPQFYFKYCSTFDSTKEGNIGPVIDDLLAYLGETHTVIAPALPVNGRSVYQGYLFVDDMILSDSHMRNHPITPMTDSNLVRLMESQSKGRAAKITYDVMLQGAAAIREKIDALSKKGINYIVLDALTEADLIEQGMAVKDMKLITGGAGLAIGLAKMYAKNRTIDQDMLRKGYPSRDKAVILSGSCSRMTNLQVNSYAKVGPSLPLDIARVVDETQCDLYIEEVITWLHKHSDGLAPMVYATTPPDELKKIQLRFGGQASHCIELFFQKLINRLQEKGYTRFIIAGGETSGAIVKALDVTGFYIGPTVAPGVPWVRSLDGMYSLVLKSGNFGDPNFFENAQKEFL